MKKDFWRIILTVLLICSFNSCTRTIYVDQNGNEVTPAVYVYPSDFVNLKVVARKDFTEVLVDLNTEVLYYVHHSGYRYGITPIMKADGTCLTYTEWKAKNGDRKAN